MTRPRGLRAQLDEARAEIERLKKWRDAITDAAIVQWTYAEADADDPRRLIGAMLAQAHREALDPVVSIEARRLHQRIERCELGLRGARHVIEEAIGRGDLPSRALEEARAIVLAALEPPPDIPPHMVRERRRS